MQVNRKSGEDGIYLGGDPAEGEKVAAVVPLDQSSCVYSIQSVGVKHGLLFL